MTDTFSARTPLTVGTRKYDIWSLGALPADKVARLPYSLKILLENLLRFEDGVNVTREDIEALLDWDPKADARLRDRLHAGARAHAGLHRRALRRRPGRDARGDRRSWAATRSGSTRCSPPSWSSTTRCRSTSTAPPSSLARNAELEFERNRERYAFLRWGQTAFENFRVVPPDTGIVHQVNLEYLAAVVFQNDGGGNALAYPDTLVGTDSHTTMINGLGVLGWGVGGIEAEAAMLGQPVTMLIPQVDRLRADRPAARRLHRHRPGADRHRDAAQEGRGREVRRVLRRRPRQPAARRPRHHRQHGAGVRRHLRHLPGRRRDAALPASFPAARPSRSRWSRPTAKAQGMWRYEAPPAANYTDVLELDLGTVEPSLAGPKRPQDRVPLRLLKQAYRKALAPMAEERSRKNAAATGSRHRDQRLELRARRTARC